MAFSGPCLLCDCGFFSPSPSLTIKCTCNHFKSSHGDMKDTVAGAGAAKPAAKAAAKQAAAAVTVPTATTRVTAAQPNQQIKQQQQQQVRQQLQQQQQQPRASQAQAGLNTPQRKPSEAGATHPSGLSSASLNSTFSSWSAVMSSLSPTAAATKDKQASASSSSSPSSSTKASRKSSQKASSAKAAANLPEVDPHLSPGDKDAQALPPTDPNELGLEQSEFEYTVAMDKTTARWARTFRGYELSVLKASNALHFHRSPRRLIIFFLSCLCFIALVWRTERTTLNILCWISALLVVLQYVLVSARQDLDQELSEDVSHRYFEACQGIARVECDVWAGLHAIAQGRKSGFMFYVKGAMLLMMTIFVTNRISNLFLMLFVVPGIVIHYTEGISKFFVRIVSKLPKRAAVKQD